MLCSNDYLGLADAPEPCGRLRRKRLEQWGAGSGASRLVAGNTRPAAQLERELAEFKGYDAAVCSARDISPTPG